MITKSVNPQAGGWDSLGRPESPWSEIHGTDVHANTVNVPQTINVKAYGALGDGATDDSSAIAAAWDALDELDGPKRLYFPKGNYFLEDAQGAIPGSPPPPFPTSTFFNTGSGTIEIYGDGEGHSIISTNTPRALFDAHTGSAGALDLIVRGLTLAYEGGWVSGGSTAVAIAASSNHINSLLVENVEFKNWTNSILLPGLFSSPSVANSGSKTVIQKCRFTAQWGVASLAAPSGSPLQTLLGSTESLTIQDNHFDGLVDPTFTGVLNSPTSTDLRALDGLVQTSGHSSGVTGNALEVIVSRNVIMNHDIEAILLDYNAAMGDTPDRNIISDNLIQTAGPNVNSYYSTNYQPAISCLRINGLSVTGNTIIGSFPGIIVLPPTGHPQTGKPSIKGNHIQSITGIQYQDVNGGTIQNNTVQIPESFDDLLTDMGITASRKGIWIGQNASNVNVLGNDISGGGSGWWSAEAEVVSVNVGAHQITVSDSTGFAGGGTVSLKPLAANGAFRFSPLDSLAFNVLTLDATFDNSYGLTANAVAGDTLVFSPSSPFQSGGIFLSNQSTGITVKDNNVSGIEQGLNRTSGSAITALNNNLDDDTVHTDVVNITNYILKKPPAYLDEENVFTGTQQFGPTSGGAGSLKIDQSGENVILQFLLDDVVASNFYVASGSSNNVILETDAGNFAIRTALNGANQFRVFPSGGVSLDEGVTDPGDGNLMLANAGVLKVNNIAVVGQQGAAVANATDATDVITQLNALLSRLRTHGLIAT